MNNASSPLRLPPGIATMAREESRAEWAILTHSVDSTELHTFPALIASMVAAGQFAARDLCVVEMTAGKMWAIARRKAAARIVNIALENNKSLKRHRRPAAWA